MHIKNHARQRFSLKRQIISICRTHKASPRSTKWLANPCIGHLVLESFPFPIIPLYSKSRPSLASLRKPVFVELKKVCEERGIKKVEGKSDLLLDKCVGHTLCPTKSSTLYNFSYLILHTALPNPQIPIKPLPGSESAER